MPEQIRILDGDLGHSGEQATHRDDFKTLVSDVAMGQVGAIFSLEASRLARSNKDWHRLLELCAITKTLVFACTVICCVDHGKPQLTKASTSAKAYWPLGRCRHELRRNFPPTCGR